MPRSRDKKRRDDARRRKRYAGHPCQSPGCRRTRVGTNRFCAAHVQRLALFGHIAGRPIAPKLEATYAAMAQDFLTRFKGSKQVDAALGLADSWLAQRGFALPGDPVNALANRLVREGVEAVEIVRAVGALLLLSHYQPHSLPADNRLLHAIGYRVARLRPIPMRLSRSSPGEMFSAKIGGTVRRAVGKAMFTMLARFWANAANFLDEAYRQRASLQADAALPFSIPPSTPSQEPSK